MNEVLLLARAFPGLEALAIRARFQGTKDLCAGLAACCPHLRSLEVRMPVLCAVAIGSLSALRGLTSLALEEHEQDHNDWAGDEQDRGPPGLLLQLSALSGLTHLRLKMGTGFDWASIPALGHTQLRSLELTGDNPVDVQEFPALAAAFPCLEQLQSHSLTDDLFMDEDYNPEHVRATTWPVGWCMPHLSVISLAEDACKPVLSVDGLLHLAAGCPALQNLSHVTVRHAQYSWQMQAADAAAVALRWLQGLSTLAGRGLLGDAEVVVGSAEQVDGVCASLKQIQPAVCSVDIATRIHKLSACGPGVDALALGRLVAHLPHLRHVGCYAEALPLVAQLRDLKDVTVLNACCPAAGYGVTILEAANGFAERRAAALNPSAAARPAARFEACPVPVLRTHMYAASIWDERAGCFEVWEASGELGSFFKGIFFSLRCKYA